MPDSQLNQTLSSELGANWESEYFESFDHIPFAAASIGQVHSAELLPASTSTFPFPFPSPFSSTPIPVAVKVQFPNIRHSIDSDLSYVRLLLTASKILPRGMFLDKTIEVMKNELADECSYVREASFLRRFASEEFLGGDKRFKVPWVWEGSTEGVLVMERMEGVSVGEAQRLELSKRDRDDVSGVDGLFSLCRRFLIVNLIDRLRRGLLNSVLENSLNSGRCKQTRIGQTSCGIQIPARFVTIAPLFSLTSFTSLSDAVLGSSFCLDRTSRFRRNTHILKRVYG